MPFDPNLPAADSALSSTEMRQQLLGLRDLIDTIPVGPEGPEGPPGSPGEVTQTDLDDAIAFTAMNPSGVTPIFDSISDPPTQTEVQTVVDKVNELIAALTR